MAEQKIVGARAILLQEMIRACDPARTVPVILHAGACGTDTAGILLAGASYSGKSTLCAALMARGLRCYADDSAIIDEELRVAGMPFPLTLRKSAWPALRGLIRPEQRLRLHNRLGAEVGFLDSNLPSGSSLAALNRGAVVRELPTPCHNGDETPICIRDASAAPPKWILD